MKQEAQQKKVAIVTGSSSGIGYATSLLLARNRFSTYATMRDIEKSANIKEIANKERLPLQVIQLDINDDGSVRGSIENVVLEKERIDVLVNNAGYGLIGAFEDLSIEEVKSQFETNFFGVIRLTQQVLPIMRKQKSGTIVNISSGAGRIGFPGMSAYVSSKFALEGLSESMSYELEPFGINVVIIEPGVIRTNFKKNSIIAKKSLDSSISSYTSLIQKMDVSISSIVEHATSPEEVAKTILHAVTSKNPKLRSLVGNDIIMMMETKKSMSDEDFQKMMMQSIMG